MSSGLFTMRLLPEEEHLFSMASSVTGRSKADLVRSIVFPALESLVADKSVCYVNGDEYARIWQDMSQGKASEDVAFEKKMLEEEEHFWTK